MSGLFQPAYQCRNKCLLLIDEHIMRAVVEVQKMGISYQVVQLTQLVRAIQAIFFAVNTVQCGTSVMQCTEFRE